MNATLAVELRGPADADGFRVKVGRYNERWYVDPLPGDHIAPTDTPGEVYPSVSTCKKASGSDWSFVALKRVATAIDTDTYRRLDQQPADHRYEALKTINKLGLEQAGRRGTNVHLMAEALLNGKRAIVAPDAPGHEYRPAVDQFFNHYQPTLVAAEFVCIHRTLNDAGYGGTSDAIIEIDGKRYLVDWKSRGADSDHGAYPEEAAQLAAYACADYIIVEGADGPERRLMPDLDGGLIVSIKPDGARVYPIDLDKAFTHWTALHAWWCARRSERDPIGHQWPARKNSPQLPPVAAVTAGEVEPTAQAPSPALSWAGTPAADPPPALPGNPDEGRTAGSDTKFTNLEQRYKALTITARQWITRLTTEAQQADVSFHSQGHHTERRYWIISGLIDLVVDTESPLTDLNDILRALCVAACGNDAPLDPRHTPGHCVGSLGAVQAERFATLVDEYLVNA